MDASTASRVKSLRNDNAQSIGIPQEERSVKAQDNAGLPANTAPIQDAPGTATQGSPVSITQVMLNSIVLEYLEKKGYRRTAEVLKTESQCLPFKTSSEPSRLLHIFGPQEAVYLTKNEEEALLAVDLRLRVLSTSPNWNIIKMRLISHIVSQCPAEDFQRSPVGEKLAHPQSHQHYPTDETAGGTAADPPKLSTNYPPIKSVYSFSDGLIIGQNSRGIMVGQVYDLGESAEPSPRHDNLFPATFDTAEAPPVEGLAERPTEEIAETEVLFHDTDEPSEDTAFQPATPRLARRTGSQSPARSLSRARSVDSTASARGTKRKFSGAADKPFFCFHDSCSNAYANSKPLETHIERSHKDKWPELPGTCDHEGSMKTFRKWDDSLSHFIHHQREFEMTRKQYDQIHHTASFWLTHSDYRVHREDMSTTPLTNTNMNSPGHLASAPFMFDTALNTDFDINAMGWDLGV